VLLQAKKGKNSKIIFLFLRKEVIIHLHTIMSIGGNHMNGRIDSGLGQIIIDTDVIATYAGSVAVECFGIVGMAAVSMKDGLVKLLGKNSLKHGISVRITEDNKIRLNFHVIVAYGVNISTIADNLVSNVKYKVEAFTGMEIDKIDIYVEGVRAID
jgi:uncharacterized alkaline shock family protein YloU